MCSNASKVLVHRSIVDEFTKRLIHKTESLLIGDPLNEATHIGASISLEHLEKVKNYIDEAISEGAKLLHVSNTFYLYINKISFRVVIEHTLKIWKRVII